MRLFSSVLGSSNKGVSNPPTGLRNKDSIYGHDARKDGRFSYGYSLNKGKRPNMEDFVCAQFKKLNSTTYGLFGIFDGHGGPAAADYVRGNLFTNMLSHPRFEDDVVTAVVDSYETTDKQYLKIDETDGRGDGCTAVTLVLWDRGFLLANAGDSRAVLCQGGRAVPLSIDHKPGLPEERARIESKGGIVAWVGTYRVSGVLAVSRAFGDAPLKEYVPATPHVITRLLVPEDELIILASDGLWDVIANEEAVTIARAISNPRDAALRLTDEAIDRGTADNISCVVIRLNPTPKGSIK